MKFGHLSKLAELAKGGIGGIAPMVVATMPGAARVLILQRHAAKLAEQSSALSRVLGDCLALAMAEQTDVPQAQFDAFRTVALEMHQSIQAIGSWIAPDATGRATVEVIIQAYDRGPK